MRSLVVALALVGCGSSSGPPKIDKGLRMTYSLDLDAVSDRAAAMKQAVAVTTARLARAHITANAFARGETLVVDIGPLDPEPMEQAKELIWRTARFEVRVVAARTPFMDALHDHVAADPAAPSAGVRAEDERWATGKGDTHEAYFISAPDRKTLRAYLDSLALTDPTFRAGDGHLIGYQRIDIDNGRPVWRAYDVHREVRLDNTAIKNATAVERGEEHVVLLQLTGDGAKKLAAFTRESVGDKVAIAIDDVIVSAPVVTEELTNGRLMIPSKDAPLLAAQLAAGALPAAMRLETQSEIVGDKLRGVDENGNYIMVPR